MKTPMRLVKEVPEIYVDQSRDMQLLLRLMDCVYGGVKFDIDSVLNLTRTDQCKSNYLQLLQSKVGFLSDKKFDLEDLRLALSAFPWLVKNKGSKKAIKQAVNAYLKMRHIKTNFNVNVINRDKENNVDKYVVQIGIEGNIGDTTILDEIFKYILPTGYEVEYVQYKQPETNAVELAYNDSIDYIIPLSGQNQTVGRTNENILTYPYYGIYNSIDDNIDISTTIENVKFSGIAAIINNYFIYGNGFPSNTKLSKGTYTFSVRGVAQGVSMYIRFNNNNAGIISWTMPASGFIKRTFTLSEDTIVQIYIQWTANKNVDVDATVKLEKGDTATPYSVPGRSDLMQSVGTQNLLEKEN